MNKITSAQLKRAIILAFSRTYIKALTEETPGDGQTHNNWDIKFENNNPILYNSPTGDNIRFTNDGTRAHVIKPKNKKALRWKVGGGDMYAFAKIVHHPGIEAQHYIEKIMENKELEKECKKILEREIEKLIK